MCNSRIFWCSFRSSRPEVFCKKGVLRDFAKFTGKHLCHSLFFNKVAGLKNSFSYRTPPVAAPAVWLICLCFRVKPACSASNVSCNLNPRRSCLDFDDPWKLKFYNPMIHIYKLVRVIFRTLNFFHPFATNLAFHGTWRSKQRSSVFLFTSFLCCKFSRSYIKRFVWYSLYDSQSVFRFSLLLHYHTSCSYQVYKSCSYGLFKEAVVRRCSVIKVFLKMSQNSQENTCPRVFF